MPTRCLTAILVLSVATFAVAQVTDDPDAADDQRFFEARIRPILVERCFECHAADTQESGLRLDSRAGVLAGGESGAVVLLDDPNKSRLATAVGYAGKVQMPPDEKLPADDIAALLEWIARGLPWPAEADKDESPSEVELTAPQRVELHRATHWAYQPVGHADIPADGDPAWVRNELDHFILARLESAGLRPSPAVDRATLLRRATYDLTGLPPTAEEMAAFGSDESPDAYAKVIDRLLASPRYGQRWGRHWLDVARYADTKGYVFTQEPRYPYSYTYRDYVIRAFNEDLPYGRFILQQLAADQLELGEDRRPLAALGFLTVGRRYSNNIHDIIDDRIDVVTRGLLGLTVTCARCHAHKYDAIPTEDYYSLYGVFASSTEPSDMPLIAMPTESEAYRKYQAELAERQQTFDGFVEEKHLDLVASLRAHVGDYLVETARTASKDELPDATFISLGSDELIPRVLDRWREYLKKTAADRHPVFAPWHALAALEADEFGERASQVVTQLAVEDSAGRTQPINPRILSALAERHLASMIDVAGAYGEVLAEVHERWQAAVAETASAEKLSDAAGEELRQVLYAPKTPTHIEKGRVRRFLDREARNKFNELKRDVDQWKASSPDAPPRAMTLIDADSPVEPKVFLRGNPRRPGDAVPRQFLAVLDGPARQPFSHGSGRLEMAQAIARDDNPLTDRVWVNRVWMHHFGAPLVTGASDFGVRSDPPTHPDLLDYLVTRFRQAGRTLKPLHRLIMLSATYRQSSADVPEHRAIDPENRLWWRTNRRRLEFEAYRDTMLAVAGRLDTTIGGRPVSLTEQPFTTRRTVYGFVDRQILPSLFSTFDFANPDASSAGRPRTTVPQQALFAMNSPFVIEQARHLADQVTAEIADPRQRVQALYRFVFGRAATDDEIDLATEFVRAAIAEHKDGEQPNGLQPWAQFAQALMMTNEFAFVD